MSTGHGRHERRRSAAEWFAHFRSSPYLPATVLVFILAAAAALFAGSYTYAMANPTPRHIPIAVVDPQHDPQVRTFLAAMNERLNGTLDVRAADTEEQARPQLEAQQVFAIIEKRSAGIEVEVASASGASVADLLSQSVAAVAPAAHLPVAVTDLIPLQRADPRGLGMFYITLAAVIVGFVGAMQLNVHAASLNPLSRIAFTAAYSLAGGFAIAAMVDWALGALRLPFPESWLILALTMFTTGMVCTMFTVLFGRWAMIPTWGLLVLLGNTSSGGAVSWPLLPSVLRIIGRWLPPGASVQAQHTAVYFGGHQQALPFVVLAVWVLCSCTVYLIAERRLRRAAGVEKSTAAHSFVP